MLQEESMNLIGCIADCGVEYVPAHEWIRICLELLDLNTQKSHPSCGDQLVRLHFQEFEPSGCLVSLAHQLACSRATAVFAVLIAIMLETFTCISTILNEYCTAE